MKRDWSKYTELTKNHPPRPLLQEAIGYVKGRDCALDLGSGALNDSIFLLGENFKRVVAIDMKPVAMQTALTLPKEKFQYVISRLEDFTFSPNTADLVSAQFSLPFIGPEHFDRVWGKIVHSLKRGGILTGQLFGDRDGWRSHTDMSFHSEVQARQLLSDFDLVSFREDEEDRPTVEGAMKHWHVFHFIARK